MHRRDLDDAAVPPSGTTDPDALAPPSTGRATPGVSGHPSGPDDLSARSPISAQPVSHGSRLPPLVSSEVALPPNQELSAHDPFAEFEEDDTDDDTFPKESTRIEASSPSLAQPLSPQPAPRDAPELIAVSGPGRGRRYRLRPGDNVVGRAVDCDVVIVDNAVSRRHCMIHVGEDVIRVRDLGSGNGSSLGGVRVTQAIAHLGDEIVVGKTHLVLHAMSASVQIEGELVGSAEFEALEIDDEFADLATVRPERRPEQPIPPPREVAARARNAPPTVPIRTQGGEAIATAAGAKLSPSALALIVVLALASGALGTLLTLAYVGRDRGDDATTATAATHAYVEGMERLASADLDGAERAFSEVLRLVPTHEKAPAQLARVLAYRGHARAVESARVALREGDPDRASSLLVTVTKESPFAAAAQVVTLAARAETFRRIEQRLTDALAEGRVQDAAAELATLRAVGAPASRIAEAQQSVAEAEAEATARTAQSATTTRNPSASTPAAGGFRFARGEVLKVYRAGQWDAAAAKAAQFAQTLPREARDEFLDLSRKIGRFADFMSAIEMTPAAAIQKGPGALQLDREISGGHYRKTLHRTMVAEQLTRARSSFTIGALDTACTAVRAALLVDASEGEARQLGKRCDVEAGRLADRARDFETSDPDEAKALYRKVMIMTAPGSAAYRAAYARLNHLARPLAE